MKYYKIMDIDLDVLTSGISMRSKKIDLKRLIESLHL